MAFLPTCLPAAVSLASCPDGSPGISNIYYCQKSDIASTTVTSNEITAFTMESGKIFFEIETDDQVSGLAEASADIRYASKSVATLTAQVPGLSTVIQTQLLSVKNCCELVFVLKLNSGLYKVMGYDIDYAAQTTTYKNCQLNVLNWDSRTGADDDYATTTIGAVCTTIGLAPVFNGTLTLS